MPTVRELKQQIEELSRKADEKGQHWELADSQERITNWRLKILAFALQLGEASTRRIICLTWGLIALTVALLVFAAAQTAIMLHENRNADSRHVQTHQNQ